MVKGKEDSLIMIYKITPGRLIFNIINYIILIFVAAVTLYPFLYVFAASLSNETFILQGKVGIIPMGFNIEAYRRVMNYPMIGRAYVNTVFYTVAGTAINMIMTILGAYPLSKKRLLGRGMFTAFITFTMLFGGGLIPTYLVIKNLGLLDTIWVMMIPGAISTWNLIVMRTFFQQIPGELEESALIDGCNDFQTLFMIILPLSIPSLATIALFYAVGHWNGFFTALIYLRTQELYPLQIILRQIVIENQMDDLINQMMAGRDIVSESIKYATIVVATVPILLVYPFIQKYFVKGVMIGALKG